MIQTQFEQIAVAQRLTLKQAMKKKLVATNVVTRRGLETQGPRGPDWYEEEQAQKRKETKEMSQGDENLVDPQDDIELNARRQEELEKDLEEEEVEKEPYDYDAETDDENEKEELSREQEEDIIITKEKQTKSSPPKKVPDKPVQVPKTKEKPKVNKPLPFPSRKTNKSDSDLYESFVEALKKLHLELPIADAIQVPTYKKFLRDILNKKKKLVSIETVAVVTSYPLEDKFPAKLGDPGIPTISCAIGKTHIHNDLYDLGAGVSVMPFYLYK